MASQSQFSVESDAHGLSADKLPALDAACLPPALVDSTAKRQRFQLDACDPLKGRYAESVTVAALRRDEPHMRDVFHRHKDLDNGLSKAAFIAALREVAAADRNSCRLTWRKACCLMDEAIVATRPTLRAARSSI